MEKKINDSSDFIERLQNTIHILKDQGKHFQSCEMLKENLEAKHKYLKELKEYLKLKTNELKDIKEKLKHI